ncbi:hypothetical protein J1605_002080 [Eschrichtius robustus]|uniref:Secreted protein n=1 Tax=Eschrichtius robustus TaxID=9764 RepID=A0AB34HZD4_ESCRO|nr:hypothetical protein J1605_002080 [Eschrichtius robustus]
MLWPGGTELVFLVVVLIATPEVPKNIITTGYEDCAVRGQIIKGRGCRPAKTSGLSKLLLLKYGEQQLCLKLASGRFFLPAGLYLFRHMEDSLAY